jgi:hypothetical protein
MEKVQQTQPISKKAYIAAMLSLADQLREMYAFIDDSMGWLDSMDRPDLFEIMHSLNVAEDLIRDMVCRLKCRGYDEAEN